MATKQATKQPSPSRSKPAAKPQWDRQRIYDEMKVRGITVVEPVMVLGVRGYFRDSMGEKGKNDRGIYDDAIFILSPDEMHSFNGNTDPSVQRKGIATLRPGVHMYKRGNHGISKPGGGYPAFRPATRDEELPVDRDGIAQPTPGVAINIHKGGENSTSSEGCQTIMPSQWNAFYSKLDGLLTKHEQTIFPYVLIVTQG